MRAIVFILAFALAVTAQNAWKKICTYESENEKIVYFVNMQTADVVRNTVRFDFKQVNKDGSWVVHRILAYCNSRQVYVTGSYGEKFKLKLKKPIELKLKPRSVLELAFNEFCGESGD